MMNKIMGLTALGFALFSFSTEVNAGNVVKTPDQLFPEQSQASAAEAKQTVLNAASKAHAVGLNLSSDELQKQWADPEKAQMPARYSDLLVLQKRIEELEKKLGK